MSLTPAICPNCGGALQVNSADRAEICSYCHNAFVVEEAINRYAMFQRTNMQHRQERRTTPVESGVEKLLNAGHSLITLKKYREADEQFLSACKEYPGDWRSWWGRLEVLDAGQRANSDYISRYVGEKTTDTIIKECSGAIRRLNHGEMPEETLPIYRRLTAYMKKLWDLIDRSRQEEEEVREKHRQLMAAQEEQYRRETGEAQERIRALKEEASRTMGQYYRRSERGKYEKVPFLIEYLPYVPFVAALLVFGLLSGRGLPPELVVTISGFVLVILLVVAIWQRHSAKQKIVGPRKLAERAEKEAAALKEQIAPAEKRHYETQTADEKACREEIGVVVRKYEKLFEAWKKEY